MFELTSKDNKVVVQHKNDNLFFHGARNMITLEEEEITPFAKLYSWEPIPSFEYHSLAEVVEAAKILNALEHEGFVCRDVHFRRIKVKSPTYVQIALLQSTELGMDSRRMLSIIQLNEGAEFLTYFPKWVGLYNEQKARFDNLIEATQKTFDSVKHIYTGKDFSVTIQKDCPKYLHNVLYKMRQKENFNLREFYAKTPTRNLEEQFLNPLEGKEQ